MLNLLYRNRLLLKRRLLSDAQKKKFDIVLVYKLDRVSRKLKDALEISDELERNKVQLMSLQENIDTTTPMGKWCSK